MNSAEKFYNENKEKNINESNILKNKLDIIGWSRLIIVLAAIFIGYIFYKSGNINFSIISSIIFFIVFIGVVVYHNNILLKKKRCDLLIDINDKGLKRISGDFKTFKDNGEEYLEIEHPFVSDLDIFGHNSLFQYINSTVTLGGRLKLVKLLKREKILTSDEILRTQEAVKELANKIKLRQNIIVEGSLNKSKKSTEENLNILSTKRNISMNIRVIVAGIFIAITILDIILSSNNILPATFLLINLLINFVVVKVLSSDIKEEIEFFESIKDYIRIYCKIFELIEDEQFECNYLKEIHSKLNYNGISCKNQIRKLNNMLDWIGNSTNNAYYLLLNILFFSDIFLMKKLNDWRNKYGDQVNIWMDVMYEIECLSSIANLAFDNESWIYPTILNENSIKAQKIGHPLIGNRAVTNTFSLKDEQKVALITGSNMSGKSTFLRTVGINLLLSYIGAPVYAEKFECGIMNIYTCMRTKDNLEESISLFYAEILRIKILIEACKKGERVFFLLDEIFKGTNSKDRHVGATVLIKQLIQYGGVGLVSTHDLELCDLENKNIVNYNFKEYYEDNKIKFDYKLRRGKSVTQNAIHLMKLAGIEIV